MRDIATWAPGRGGQGTRKGGMNASEAAAHEEIQLKMRKAMGESLRDAEPGEDQDAYQRRLNLIRQRPLLRILQALRGKLDW